MSKAPTYDAKEKKRLAGEVIGNAFDANDRLFPDWENGDVFEYKYDADDIKTMLKRSGKARSCEQVLTLPLRSATWKIQGGSERARALVTEQFEHRLNKILDQMTGAISYSKQFFEINWEIDEDGQAVIDDVAWRPPTSCEAGFDPKSGRPSGFRQRVAHPDGILHVQEGKGTQLGYVRVPANKAFVYTHGTHREPVHGVSDLDVAYWCYETQQKIFYLWFRYLEQQSLPSAVAYGDDPAAANANAEALATLKAGGTVGMQRTAGEKPWDIIESSGKGADQFMQAINYLDSAMVTAILAGFTELAQSQSTTGSFALSADQSEFFLASRQAVADEMGEAVADGLFAPLVRYNFGVDEEVPKLIIGPLSKSDTDRAFDLLKAIVSAPNLNVPGILVDELVKSTAVYLGLDEKVIEDAIEEFAVKREEQEAVKMEQQKALAAAQTAGVGMGVAGGNVKPKGSPADRVPGGKKIENAVHGAAAVMKKKEGANKQPPKPTPPPGKTGVKSSKTPAKAGASA